MYLIFKIYTESVASWHFNQVANLGVHDSAGIDLKPDQFRLSSVQSRLSYDLLGNDLLLF